MSVVELEDIAPGIVQVTMQDKESKNTFSDALMLGIIDAFETIETRTDLKVVILTGYDSYFSSGGTQEGLQYLSQGKTKFTDKDLYSLALNCPIPVIAAMQGHGIGGGFVMGMFADFVVLSRESIYTTNFMKYGFTPGMGGTMIVPEKLGTALAHEMMLGAKNYRGAELAARGIPYPVLPRAEVLPYAIDLAHGLAEKPRVSLVTLKDHLVAALREQLPKTIEQEVLMHEKTIHQPEVVELINKNFGR
ncbi:MAG: polyketide biosynthesis enoyl-CoA hydratase PksI [Phenylobacterium sp.]|jgi:polyketide biosynthesis enoyl-CoA hydratase PksI